MAYVKSTRVDPRDLNKNTAIGVKLPFNAPGVFYSTFSTKKLLSTWLIWAHKRCRPLYRSRR